MAARLGALCALILSLGWVVPSVAFQNEQQGFEKLKPGESVEQAKKTFPDMRKLANEYLGATVVTSPYIGRYSQPDLILKELPEPLSLELRFWKERLWVVIAYYGDNSHAQITEMLEQRYGKAGTSGPDSVWSGEEITIATSAKDRWFSMTQNAIAKEVQTLFLKEMQGLRQGRSKARPTAPASEPTPAK